MDGQDVSPRCCEPDILSPASHVEKREMEKVQRVEVVEAIVDLIARAREEEEQARERGNGGKADEG